MSELKAVDTLLNKYAESHQNHVNELIHFACVPAIMWTALALIWAIHPALSVAAGLLALAYYISLSIPLAIGMGVMAAIMLGILYVLPPAVISPAAIIVFVVAWIFQFIGHKIEGEKPSFFDDLRFLLIGPLFVLGFLYRRLKITY